MVLVQVATRMVLNGDDDEEVTQPVSMVDANRVLVQAVKLEGTTTVTIEVWKSNDLENWFKDASGTLTTGDARITANDIGFAWVRLRMVNPSMTAGTNIVAASVNTIAG